METFSLVDLLRIHHEALEGVFRDTFEPLLASQLEEAFQTSNLSEPGSIRRKEARTVEFWRDWLIEVEGKKVFLSTSLIQKSWNAM